MRCLGLLVLVAACDSSSPGTTDAMTNGDGGVDAPAAPDAVRRVHQRRRRHRLVRRQQDDRRADRDLVDRRVPDRRQLPRIPRQLRLCGHERRSRRARTRLDPATAGLTFINDVASGGTGPAHISVDRSGKFVLVANYGSGHIAVMPVQPNGGLGAASQTILAGANAHQIMTDPSNQLRRRAVPRRRQGRPISVRTRRTGMLTANAVAEARHRGTAQGRVTSRSRPTASTPISINEIEQHAVGARVGRQRPGDSPSCKRCRPAPTGATGTNTSAEVVVHPNGKFVYGSNRGDNNIVVFAIDPATGMVTADRSHEHAGHDAAQLHDRSIGKVSVRGESEFELRGAVRDRRRDRTTHPNGICDHRADATVRRNRRASSVRLPHDRECVSNVNTHFNHE